MIQGDSLSILVADLRRGIDLVQQGESADGAGWLQAVLETLEAVKRTYETVLAENSIPLPY